MTSSGRPRKPYSIPRVVPILLASMLAVVLAGCKTTYPEHTVGSVGAAAAVGDDADRRGSAEGWEGRDRANPEGPEAAVHHAQRLRANGLRAQAVAVLERAATSHPKHHGVLGAYGRALADVGHYQEALDVLDRAHGPSQPDWRILSAQGAALDQLGRHEEAQRYYGTALRLAPDEPSVLSNLGLSYALSKDLVRAEATLRRAAGHARVDPRVRRNLALVVDLQGRSSVAESVTQADMSSSGAVANFTYLRQVLAQQNGWKQPDQLAKTVTAEGS